MATTRIAAPAARIQRPSRLPRVEGLGWMMLYVAAALIFLRFFLPLRLPGALLTLAAALVAAAVVAAWRAPRMLARIAGEWQVPGPVHALDETTVGALLSAPGGAAPFELEAFNPTTRRADAVLRLKGLGAEAIRPSWTTRFPRRGLVRLPPLVARCDQPFGLLSAARAISDESEVLVLPALGSIKKGLQARLQSWLEMHATTTSEAGDDELAQLRDYRPGDAPHSIHWRASARARTLMVTERHALGCKRLALVVDTQAEGEGPRFERLLSAAATLVHELGAQGWSLTLRGAFAPQGVHGGRERMLEALALATPDSRPVGEFVARGVPTLVLCLGEPPRLEFAPRPLALSLAEVETLVHIPTRVR